MTERDERDESGTVGLGLRLRRLRAEAGWTLAQAAGAADVSVSYLSDIERGRRLPALDRLDRICAAYGVLVSDALAGVYPYGSAGRPRALSRPPDGRSRAAGA
jgi:transcriptional regulator with XRE-family HTH domain